MRVLASEKSSAPSTRLFQPVRTPTAAKEASLNYSKHIPRLDVHRDHDSRDAEQRESCFGAEMEFGFLGDASASSSTLPQATRVRILNELTPKHAKSRMRTVIC